ncbi:hypothetical protein ACFRFH_09555 [Leifsonia sp. NPDC056824]|uniref:hypothetical protein n=1 Tax=Leifsonia sp. NPDC056824 TaxID=3345953 RepID=UPI00368CC34F
MAVDDPTGFNASLAGQLKRINERLGELSAAPLGKVKWGLTFVNPLHPTITPAPTSLIATIAVPPLATQCGYSILATGLATNPSATTAGTLTVKLAVTCGSYTKTAPNQSATVSAGQAVQVGSTLVDTFMLDPGVSTITITASVNCDAGTWTDPNNTLTLTPMALFAY